MGHLVMSGDFGRWQGSLNGLGRQLLRVTTVGWQFRLEKGSDMSCGSLIWSGVGFGIISIPSGGCWMGFACDQRRSSKGLDWSLELLKSVGQYLVSARQVWWWWGGVSVFTGFLDVSVVMSCCDRGLLWGHPYWCVWGGRAVGGVLFPRDAKSSLLMGVVLRM
eukprot:gene3313-6562_t